MESALHVVVTFPELGFYAGPWDFLLGPNPLYLPEMRVGETGGWQRDNSWERDNCEKEEDRMRNRDNP